jgi:hypothetical protein
MNPIHQSLSSLLSNPALQPGSASTSGRSGAARSAARPETEAQAPAADGLSSRAAARQALASQNEGARLNVVGDLAEAKELTRLMQSALRGGMGDLVGAHASLDSRHVASLIR